MMSETSDNWLEQRSDNGIVLARLDRPPANALTIEFLLAIEANFDRLAADDTARAIILEGADKVFSAGMDLKMLATLDETGQRDVVDALNRAYGAMYGFPKPFIAAARGHAIAGGLFFLLTADYRIAAAGPAKFGLSEVRVGVAFPVAPLEIARTELTPAACRRLMLGGHPIAVDEALSAGIIDEVAPPSELQSRALVQAEAFAASPAAAYARIKHQLRAPALAKIRRAIVEQADPMLDGWFAPETTTAALAVLSGSK